MTDDEQKFVRDDRDKHVSVHSHRTAFGDGVWAARESEVSGFYVVTHVPSGRAAFRGTRRQAETFIVHAPKSFARSARLGDAPPVTRGVRAAYALATEFPERES